MLTGDLDNRMSVTTGGNCLQVVCGYSSIYM